MEIKKIFIIILLLIGANNYSQNSEKFKPGVKVTENVKIAEYKKPSSILFIFKGDTHLINNFLNLRKRLKKSFKKKMKKEFKNFILDFDYDLYNEKPFKSDLANIPSEKHNLKEYQTICYVNLSDFKNWDDHLIEKRKQNYNLNIELKDINSNLLISLKLNINSYNTILTQNKNSSKLIYQTIMEN